MQVLTSDGHTGAYVYENEATKLTVAYKSNDTVFDDNALLVLTADEAGTAQLYVNDVLADTKTVGAGDEMKFEPELKKGEMTLLLYLLMQREMRQERHLILLQTRMLILL